MSNSISNGLKRFALFSFILCLYSIYCSVWAENIEKKSYTIATWNIGHFSNGAKSYSMIDVATYNESLAKYRTLIYDDIRPDVMTVNEYNVVFCGKDTENTPYKTSSLLFDGFNKNVIGSKCLAVCNAIFSKIKMGSPRTVDFVSQKNIEGDDFVRSRENYFIESELKLNGKKVKLVCMHLLFSSKVDEIYQQKQIEELISYYKNRKRVIICGDWNTEALSSLKDAGYKLANDGSLKTYPLKKSALDNIAVKGLDVSDVRVVKTNLSDHYPLVCRVSLK